ncbi:MAG: hypothetical protein SNJ77_05965, partial [Cytophagales bacterium]
MKEKKNDKEKAIATETEKNLRRRESIYWVVIALLVIGLIFMIAKPDKKESIAIIEQETILNHVQNIDEDIKVLEMSKDTFVVKQAKKLKNEIEEIKKQLENKENLSTDQQVQLQKQLNYMQMELKRIKTEYEAYQENISLNMMDMIDLKEKELITLREENETLKKALNEEKSLKTNKEIVVVNKQSQINFNVVTLNKKNVETTKAKYVSNIWCNMKVNGDMDLSNIEKLRVQITDPIGVVITNPEDF